MRDATYDDDDLPRARSRRMRDEDFYDDEDETVERRVPLWRRNIGDTIAATVIGAVAIGIGVNALVRQNGPHPAPLFTTALIQPAQAAAPVPPARPAEAQAAAPQQQVAAPVLAAATSTPAADPAAARARNETVADIQRELTRRRLYDGTVDGLTGPKTEAAIRQYQAQAGLRQTGEANDGLLGHMRRPAGAARTTATAPAAPAPARVAAAPARPAEPQTIGQLLEREGRPQPAARPAQTRTAAATPPTAEGPRSIGDLLTQDTGRAARPR